MNHDGTDFGTLSTPNTRLTRPWDEAVTSTSLREALRRFPWFGHLGEHSPWDELVVRLSGWSAWPGPEDGGCAALFEQQQEFYDGLTSDDADGHMAAMFEDVRAEVVGLARTVVPHDENQDAWHAPTAAVWSAGWTAALVVSFHTRGLPPPDDLLEQWRWYEAGHWAAGYEAPPGSHLLRLIVL